MRGLPALPVAKIISVSEVEVSPSMVTALKVSATPSLSSACSAAARDRCVGEDERQHGRHVGCDHAGALGDAVDRSPCLADACAVAVATFGKVSVVMIALAAARKSPGCARWLRPSITGANFEASSGSPITPVEARKISAGLQPRALRGEVSGELGRGAAALAGKGVGIAGIDHQRPCFAGLQMRAAPFDRRRRAFRFGEDAGGGGALVEQRQQHVGAARVADAGCGGGEPARRRLPACPARAWGRGGRWRCSSARHPMMCHH